LIVKKVYKMGIRNFNNLIWEYSMSAISPASVSQFRGKRLALDANLLLCRLMKEEKETKDTPHPYLQKMYNITRWLKQHDVDAVFVWDGPKKLAAKLPELQQRKEKKERAARVVQETKQVVIQTTVLKEEITKKLEIEQSKPKHIKVEHTMQRLKKEATELGHKMKSYEHRIHACENDLISPKDRHFVATKKLLHALGYQQLQSDHEAEATCAKITDEGITDVTVTEDTDALCFGNGPVIRQFAYKLMPMVVWDPVEARRKMGITREQFIDVAILCGCDFASTIEGITSQQAYLLIKRFKTIEKILELLEITPDQAFQYQTARNIYLNKDASFQSLKLKDSPDTALGLQHQLAQIIQQYQLKAESTNYSQTLSVFQHRR